MPDRTPADDLVDLADRAERLAQDIADLRRRIESRSRRRPSSSDYPAVSPDKEVSRNSSPPLPGRSSPSDAPRGGDTPQWLPVLKSGSHRIMTSSSTSEPRLPRSEPRSFEEPSRSRTTTMRPPPGAPPSRAPGSGVRPSNPEAGRYSIVATSRGRRRDGA